MRKSLLAIATSIALVFAGTSLPAHASGSCTLSGSGTSGDAYLVNNLDDLLQTGTDNCSGDGMNFLQTNDIYLPVDWAGDMNFIGVFDGDGYYLGFDQSTAVTKNNYGIWANVGDVNSENPTVITNVVSGGVLSTTDGSGDFNHVGFIAGSAHNASLSHDVIDGSITAPNATSYLGGLVGYSEFSSITYVTSRVSISGGSGLTQHVGGISGHDEFGYITNSKWNGDISFADHAKYVGGIAGDSFDSVFHDNTVGTHGGASIYVDGGESVGGLVGTLANFHLNDLQPGGRSYSNEVVVTLDVPSVSKVGALIGEVTGNGTSPGDASVYQNYATGTISAGGDKIGGLIGWLDGDGGGNPDVHDNAAMGTIDGLSGVGYFGALIGAEQNSNIHHNYTRVVLGSNRSGYGGIIGRHPIAGMHNNIWSDTVSGAVNNPYDVNVGEGEMQNTQVFANQGFSISGSQEQVSNSTWIRCDRVNDGFPFLRIFNSGFGCQWDQTVPVVTISGSTDAGTTLTGNPGTWDNSTTQTYSWFNNGDPILDVDGNPIVSDTYTTKVADIGHQITFKVTSSGAAVDKATATATSDPITVTNISCSLSGSGTSEDPYLVGSVSDLLQTGTNVCSGDGVYFLQTDDIYVPTDWAGDLTFVGNYDGDSFDLDFDQTTNVTHEDYGIWGSVGDSNSQNPTVIKYVYAGGNLTTSDGTTDFSNVGFIAGNSSNTTFDHVWVSGGVDIPNYVSNVGGLVGGSSTTTFSHITANVQIFSVNGAGFLGGIAGFAETCYFDNSSWDGGITVMGNGNVIGGITGLAYGTVFHDIQVGMNSETGILSHGGQYIGGMVGVLLGDNNFTSSAYHNQISVGVGGYDADYVGLLAGAGVDVAGEGNSLNVYENIVNGYLSGSGDSLGGLFGQLDGDTGSTASVHDNEFLGYMYAGDGATNVGTLVGSASGTTVRFNYSRGTISNDLSGSKGIVGNLGNYTVMTNNIWSDAITGQVAEPFGENVSAGDMQLTATYSDHDFDISGTQNLQSSSVWIRCNRVNDGFPFLRYFDHGTGCLIDQNVPTPTITGDTAVGSVLTADPGNWDVLTTQTYQWLRDGSPISGATSLTYTITTEDAGHAITFAVTSAGLPADENDANATTAAINVAGSTSGGGGNSGGGGSTPTAFLVKTLSGFVIDNWKLPKSVKAGLKQLNREASSATSVLCVGIVAKFGTSTWQKKVGLARAQSACNLLKSLHPTLTFTTAYKVAKPGAKIRRGVAVTFYR